MLSLIKGVSLDNLGPFITSGGRDTGAGPPEPLDSHLTPNAQCAFECCGAAAAGALPAHCRRTARACATRSAEPVYCAESATRAFAHGKARWRCERRGELREDDEVPNESRCPPRRRPSRRRGKRRCESQQRLAAVPPAPTTSPTSLAAPRDSQLAGARAPAAHSVPPTATTSSRWLSFECETLGGAGGRRR